MRRLNQITTKARKDQKGEIKINNYIHKQIIIQSILDTEIKKANLIRVMANLIIVKNDQTILQLGQFKMDFSDQNSPQAINQSYKIWKINVPFLYNILQVYQLPSCSQTVDWIPESYISDNWQLNKLVIGSNSITKNYIMVIDLSLPTDDSLVDYTSYREVSPSEANVGTLGQRHLKTYRSFPQNGEIMRTRVSKIAKSQMLAACVGGQNYQYFIYDISLSPELIDKNKITLIEHDCEGFGLDWHPTKQNQLVSGAYDKKACIWDISGKSTNSIRPIKVLEHESGVGDAKWFRKDQNLIATGTQDKYINIWDIRQTSKKPSITRNAHNGQVSSVDLNNFSAYLLLSGGQDGDINLWDTRNMSRSLHKFIGHNDVVTKVEWSTKNPHSFTSSSFDRRIVTWNMNKLGEGQDSNQLQFIHGGHRSKVLDFCWNQKGAVCASTQENNILQVWQMNDKIKEP